MSCVSLFLSLARACSLHFSFRLRSTRSRSFLPRRQPSGTLPWFPRTGTCTSVASSPIKARWSNLTSPCINTDRLPTLNIELSYYLPWITDRTLIPADWHIYCCCRSGWCSPGVCACVCLCMCVCGDEGTRVPVSQVRERRTGAWNCAEFADVRFCHKPNLILTYRSDWMYTNGCLSYRSKYFCLIWSDLSNRMYRIYCRHLTRLSSVGCTWGTAVSKD